MPSSDGSRGRPFRAHCQVVEGIIYRFRTGIAWRDLPASFGPWQTVWKRNHRFSLDGAWDRIHARLAVAADATGDVVWDVSADLQDPARCSGDNLTPGIDSISSRTRVSTKPRKFMVSTGRQAARRRGSVGARSITLRGGTNQPCHGPARAGTYPSGPGSS